MKSYRLLTKFFSEDEILSLRIATKNPEIGTGIFSIIPSNALEEIYDKTDYGVHSMIAACKLAHIVLNPDKGREPNFGELFVIAASISTLSPVVGCVLVNFLRSAGRL